MEKRLFTSESVTEGHPDKICDQISDAVLDALYEQDPYSRVACETLTNTGFIMVMGEVTTKANIDIPSIVRKTVTDIGYDSSDKGFDGNTCAVMVALDKQSADIAMGVDKALEAKDGEIDDSEGGAGDQGMMFGYACNETDNYMPVALDLSHRLLMELADIRREANEMTYIDASGARRTYLRPDSKSQVTVEYPPEGYPVRVDTIVISTQHDEFILPDANRTQAEADIEMQRIITEDVRRVLIPRLKAKLPQKVATLIGDDYKLYVNPTGKFVIGGPHGDTGLTGRKIIVDTYGGRGAHGGGAFSGKDCTKVDRSAAYAARYVAKNIVAAGLAEKCEIQLSYAIGVAHPTSIMVDTFGTGKLHDDKLVEIIRENFDLRPAGIIKMLDLRRPIYKQTASYGHFGRTDVDLPWEKLDKVDLLKKYLA